MKRIVSVAFISIVLLTLSFLWVGHVVYAKYEIINV